LTGHAWPPPPADQPYAQPLVTGCEVVQPVLERQGVQSCRLVHQMLQGLGLLSQHIRLALAQMPCHGAVDPVQEGHAQQALDGQPHGKPALQRTQAADHHENRSSST
jgi:hypothetical protein